MYLDLPDQLLLDNGLRLIITPSECSNGVHVRADVLMGSCDERLARDKGVCHLIGGLVWRGTKDFPNQRVAEMAASAGGLTGSVVHGTHTSYTTWSPMDDGCRSLEAALSLLDSVIFRPNLDVDDLEIEKKLAAQRISDRNSDARSYSVQAAKARTFPKHGVGYSEIGTLETVLNMKITRLREYVRGYHRPQTVVLGLSGRLPNFERIESVLGDHATGFVNKTRAANAIPLGRSWGPAVPVDVSPAHETWSDRGQSTVSAVVPLPDDMTTPQDHVSLMAAARAVGQGRRSWLHERLVSKGAALTVDCGFERVPGAGWLWIVVQTTNAKEQSVVDGLVGICDQFIDHPTRWSEHLDTARTSLLAEMRSRSDAEWLMNATMDAESTDGAIPDINDRIEIAREMDGRSFGEFVSRLGARNPSIYTVRQ